MKALVTGSAGFLGRHFVRALLHRGYSVQRVDVRSREPWDAREYYRYASSHVDLAVHCAAVVGGRQTIEGSPLELAVDFSLDAEFFTWAARTRPGRVVYLSSSAVYPVWLQRSGLTGGLGGYRLREEDVDLDRPELPDALYGWSKLTGEILARHARQTGVAVTVVRPFSGYGVDQDPAYPFRAMLERARAHEDPFTIWGDGRQVRDWIHVSDVVEATLTLAEERVDGPVNLGLGRPVDMLTLAEMVCREAGYKPEVECRVDRPAGVSYRVAEPSRLLNHYRPRVSLEEGVRMAVAGEAAA